MARQEMSENEQKVLDEALQYVYIAQHARSDGPMRAGVLDSDCRRYFTQIEELYSQGRVEPVRWYNLTGFRTTPQGDATAHQILMAQLKKNTDRISLELDSLAPRVAQFILQEVILLQDFDLGGTGRIVRLEPNIGWGSDYHEFNTKSSHFCFLSRLQEVRNARDLIFDSLLSLGLAATAHSYVGTNRGEIRELMHVPAIELERFSRDYLASRDLHGNLFSRELEDIHTTFHLLYGLVGGAKPERSRLESDIPVRLRGSVEALLEECLAKGILQETTYNPGESTVHLVAKDVRACQHLIEDRFWIPLVKSLLAKDDYPTTAQKEGIQAHAVIEDMAEPNGPADRMSPDPSAVIGLESNHESLLLGNYHHSNQEVAWQPGKGQGVHQPNRNVVIVGKPGTGKTELIKALISDLARQGIPSISLDWVSQYADVLPNVLDAQQGVTIDPLELPSDTGPYQTAMEVSSIIRSVFKGLGDIQEALLREAVLEAYVQKGIRQTEPEHWTLPTPKFEDVFNALERARGGQRNAADGLLARIRPLQELNIFGGANTLAFDQIVTEGASVLLQGLFTDELRITVGQFFLNKLWYYIQNLGETNQARFYLILDEADRLSFPGSPIERLVREARKFGVGIIVASQRPGDFTETVPANAACSIVFQCPSNRDAAFMGKQINCSASAIQTLSPTFDALVKFDYQPELARVRVIPHFERTRT